MKYRFMLSLAIVVMVGTTFAARKKKPNVIMMMCDDMGFGDVGFNGNPHVKTPNLDKLATDGANLTQFYSIGPVCSPTRVSFVTGRHHYRTGVYTANRAHLPKEENTIAKMLKSNGYTTGHFGKWHMGTLNREISIKGPARKPEINFAPPWERDYDRSFVTECAVKTWNPREGRQAPNNPYYEDGVVTNDNVEGGSSRIIMDRVIPFVQDAVEKDKPFLSVIWFNAPHKDVEAGPEYLKRYEGYGGAAHYFGCISEMDDQVGRLRAELKRLGIEDNTIIFFTSDNGPLGGVLKSKETYGKSNNRLTGNSGGFTGGKRSFHEGGVRVPGLAYWPGKTKPGSTIDVPMSVLDYLPTLAGALNIDLPKDRILDGENILPILQGKKKVHEKSIPFRYESQAWLVKGNYKLIIESATDHSKDVLYNLSIDKTEENNIVSQHPEKVAEMRKEILEFLASAKNSHDGGEYKTDFQPVEPWHELGQLSRKAKKKKQQH